MPDSLEKRFREAVPKGVGFWSVRRVNQVDEVVSVRQDVPQPTSRSRDTGAMITVVAGGGEWPESFDMSAGDFEADAILQRLGTGVCVNTLWYLNYSDRPAGRITGMTRFATFWVEGGNIVAPLKVMRFHETIYRMLGENLLALTSECDFIPEAQTYKSGSTDSIHLPGALMDNFRFTL